MNVGMCVYVHISHQWNGVLSGVLGKAWMSFCVCMYMYKHVCMHVCMYAYIYTRTCWCIRKENVISKLQDLCKDRNHPYWSALHSASLIKILAHIIYKHMFWGCKREDVFSKLQKLCEDGNQLYWCALPYISLNKIFCCRKEDVFTKLQELCQDGNHPYWFALRSKVTETVMAQADAKVGILVKSSLLFESGECACLLEGITMHV